VFGRADHSLPRSAASRLPLASFLFDGRSGPVVLRHGHGSTGAEVGDTLVSERSVWARMRAFLIGQPRELGDRQLFHKVSLIAVLAWVGLGADGLSSSCYGPEETFKALGNYPSLAIIIALMCCGTIAVICASYRQIIELFPTGGGGYLVASKLLGKSAGVVSGSALIVDYVLTITISIASGADALFSLLPEAYLGWKVPFAVAGILCLTILNLRGVRESVLLLAPIFFAFLLTHAFAILLAVGIHLGDLGNVVVRTGNDLQTAHTELGLIGIVIMLLRAFSVGAGTYTGIEAVSNGLPVLREPRAETGKRTMVYMGLSLGITVFGLLLAYMLVGVKPVGGLTLNAVLFESITASWPKWSSTAFVSFAMLSATALLFIAAQAGFLDGPRVLANMALDRWFPTRFATLSDRFVAQNGILVMSGASLAVLLLTNGSVSLLVVLYSINVFLTFSLSQLGMCVHWIRQTGDRRRKYRGLAINGLGLLVTGSVLVSLTTIKFFEGGWITLIATAAVVTLAYLVRSHYATTEVYLRSLDRIVAEADRSAATIAPAKPAPGMGRTAIVLCNGFNGLGVHTFFNIFRTFPATFDRFVFLLVGPVDAGTFKGAAEIERLKEETHRAGEQYADLCRKVGLAAEVRTAIGSDVLTEIEALAESSLRDHPNAILFAGQLAFLQETAWTRLLHNYFVFTLQRHFCRKAVPFVIVPIRIDA
jgi:amino acid transporter